MKKLLSLILTILMLLSVTSCSSNKKAFNSSKEAYMNVNSAYEIIENFGSDVYEAWRIGIYDEDERDFGLSYLAKELNLTEEELKIGYVYFANEDKWDSMSDSEIQKKVNSAETDFKFAMIIIDSTFSLCVNVVTCAYEASGKTAEVQGYLDAAKEQMRALSENYSDYEHYPSLKSYYTTTSSFFDFCKDPNGSFEQIKTTIENYRSTARDYNSDLNYIFVD